MRTQHFSVHTATVTTHHPALLALHNRTQLGVARAAPVTAQVRLAVRTARDRPAEHAVLGTLARGTAEGRVEGTLGERGAGGERGGADEAGTEDGERRRTDGKQRAERQV